MLFEVLLRQAYNSRNVLNRWFYSGSGTPAAVQMSFALASAFGGIPDDITSAFPDNSVMLGLANLQSTGLVYVELAVENLYDVGDFYTIPYSPSQNGEASGPAMSPFVAYAAQSNRIRTDIRRGNKRFAGVTEDNIDAYGALSSGALTALGNICTAMSETLEYDDEGNTLSFQPTVLSFEKHAPDTDHKTEWYSLYETLAEQEDHAAVGVNWTAKAYMTTQNTRKK